MWVFGYGSLMSDGWERDFGCTRRVVAELRGYRCAFNKASVKNWGTQQCPCPTLNLERSDEAVCVGIAFEFSDVQRGYVDAYLSKREGKDFRLVSMQIVVAEVGAVDAVAPLYMGKNICSFPAARNLVIAVQQACGTSGFCSDYVFDIYHQLKSLGIEDAAVSRLVDLLGGERKNAASR